MTVVIQKGDDRQGPGRGRCPPCFPAMAEVLRTAAVQQQRSTQPPRAALLLPGEQPRRGKEKVYFEAAVEQLEKQLRDLAP